MRRISEVIFPFLLLEAHKSKCFLKKKKTLVLNIFLSELCQVVVRRQSFENEIFKMSYIQRLEGQNLQNSFFFSFLKNSPKNFIFKLKTNKGQPPLIFKLAYNG